MYQLMILDINLPGMSGLQLLEQLRAKHDALPILFLTARDTPHQRATGLNMGADDYLIKPFDLDELLARCAALIRRSQGLTAPIIQHKDLCYNLSTMSLIRDDMPIILSAKERHIFDLLIRNINRAISKEQIMENIYDWSSEHIESNTIEVHIAALRKKLGRDIIKTQRGIGYMITS